MLRLVFLVVGVLLTGCSSSSQGGTGGGADGLGSAGGTASGGGASSSGGGAAAGGGTTSAGGGTASAGGGSSTGGGAGGFSTLAELLAVAPLASPFQGSLATFDGLSFVVPQGWSYAPFPGDRAVMERPAGPGELPCQIFIFSPVTAAATEEGRYTQLLDKVRALYPPGTVIGAEFNPDPLRDRRRGRAGAGWTFNGLQLRIGGVDNVNAYLAVFGTQAVMVLENEPGSSSCNIVGRSIDIEPSTVFHSLDLDGWQPASVGLRPELLGKWSVATGSGGALTLFAANGNFLIAVGTSGQSVDNGILYDVTSTWAGDGPYVNIGSALGYLGANRSTRLARIIEETSELYPGGWVARLCETGTGTDGKGFESCLFRSE